MRGLNLRHLTSITVCVLGSTTIVDYAHACSCIPVTVSELMESADIIFRGTIIDVHDVQTGVGTEIGMGVGRRVVLFRVKRVWKGDVGEILEIPAIENPSGICWGFPKGLLAVGNELLVYARRQDGSEDYITNICSHTSLATRTKDFQELGRGKAPRKKFN